ncbi:hypothetical protein EJ02DRAFT_78274 [Clathrospora elynae]|uniref:DUF7907 domain-containing protein n=1 Tax=Clathrospora elynae TaxID=706981 RepID=A0A6A5T6U3_9PLEO|nr:hypothetical protein EJ02DRAFT_78274 [Clathrospora elynae]
MKTTSVVLLLAAAAFTSAEFNETSAPFHLVVTSDDGCINDTLSACHTGAALESLCRSNAYTNSDSTPLDPATFYFNTSDSQQAPAPSLGVPGILTWFLPVSGATYSSSVYFYYDPTTDIAVPILSPGEDDVEILAFDAENELTVQGYVDWSQNPPKAGNYTQYYRWYICNTYYEAYQYNALAWGLGPGKPENPTCVAVNVTRVFI